MRNKSHVIRHRCKPGRRGAKRIEERREHVNEGRRGFEGNAGDQGEPGNADKIIRDNNGESLNKIGIRKEVRA